MKKALDFEQNCWSEERRDASERMLPVVVGSELD